MDSISATQRLTFGLLELSDGIGLIPAIMGLFGVAEVIANVEQEIKREIHYHESQEPASQPAGLEGQFLAHDPRGNPRLFHRHSPGPAPVISAFSSYAIEKKLSKHPEKIRHGHDPGVAGPEAANNAATGGAFIPLFTLGIPSNSVIAILLGHL